MRTPRFFRDVDIRPSLAYDDLMQTRRSFREFLSLCKSAIVSNLLPTTVSERRSAVFFPMHHSKYAQMVPFEAELPEPPLFILVPWGMERFQIFNRYIKETGRPWVMLRQSFPWVFWWHLLCSLPYWMECAMGGPRRGARRLAQYFELYGQVCGIQRIMAGSGAKILFSSYEDSYYSSTVSQVGRKAGFLSVNVMHGNSYLNAQYFDWSLVFGNYHKRFLEENTASHTRFVISGSATIRDSGSAPKFPLARRLIYFDQPACDIFPAAVKIRLLDMLTLALARIPGIFLTLRPHPASGVDTFLAEFLRRNPSVLPPDAGNGKSVAQVLEGHGISLTGFSTAGLEAIASGNASIFVNPGGELNFGPLGFMGEFTLRTQDELESLLDRLVSDAVAYDAYLGAQKRTLGEHYLLEPFDYGGFVREAGLLGASRRIS